MRDHMTLLQILKNTVLKYFDKIHSMKYTLDYLITFTL